MRGSELGDLSAFVAVAEERLNRTTRSVAPSEAGVRMRKLLLERGLRMERKVGRRTRGTRAP
jgi:hypothetical protein